MASTHAASHLHTAAVYRTAAEIWRNDGSKPHADFVSTLETWAANAERRAREAAAGEQPEQMELFA